MEHFLASWGYVALFAVTLISAMGIPIGSELVMAYGGALASGQLTTTHHDHLVLVWVIVVGTLGEVVGSLIGYTIGYVGGRPVVDRLGKYVLVTRTDLDRAEAWLDGRGESAIFIGRLIPLIRSFVSLAGGLARMRLTKFVLFTVLGSAVFVAALSGIGYSLGHSWHTVIKDFSDAGYVALVLAVLAVAAVVVHRIRLLRRERA